MAKKKKKAKRAGVKWKAPRQFCKTFAKGKRGKRLKRGKCVQKETWLDYIGKGASKILQCKGGKCPIRGMAERVMDSKVDMAVEESKAERVADDNYSLFPPMNENEFTKWVPYSG